MFNRIHCLLRGHEYVAAKLTILFDGEPFDYEARRCERCEKTEFRVRDSTLWLPLRVQMTRREG